MAFKGLRFARAEVRNTTANTAIKIAMAAISVIPLLYGALYLFAFLDPYEQLNTVPVAVVNADAGANVNGEFRVVGDDVVTRLRDNSDGLGWNFVSQAEATRGLEDGSYYMTCTIPENFTAAIASADSASPEAAQLVIDYNQTKNMLASQIGGTVWKEVRQQVSDSVAQEYWETVFGKINDGADDLQEAADGASKLEWGLVDAQAGSRDLADNMAILHSGAKDLAAGTDKLMDGEAALASGTAELSSGAKAAASGAGELADGFARLAEGASDLESGSARLSSGAASLTNGAKDASAGGKSLAQGSAALVDGANSLSAGNADLASGSSKLEAGAKASKEGSAALAAGAGSLAEGANSLAEGNKTLLSGAKQLKGQGSSVLAAGAAQLEQRTSALPDEDAVQVAKAGSARIARGIDALALGLVQLKGDASSKQGLAYAAAASHKLSDSLSDTIALDGALDQLGGGVSQIQEGRKQACGGLSQVDAALDGAAQQVDGALVALGSIDASALDPAQRAALAQAQALLAADRQGASATIAAAKGGLSQVSGGLADGAAMDVGLQGISSGLDQLGETTDASLAQASDAAGQIATGLDGAVAALGSTEDAESLIGGTAAINAGFDSFSGQLLPLVEATPALKDAVSQLSRGAFQLDESMASLVQGATEASAGADQLSTGATTLSGGARNLDAGLGELLGGTTALAQGAQAAAAGSMQLASGTQALDAGAKELSGGLDVLFTGASQLSSGSIDLASGASTLRAGMEQAAQGASSLQSGTAKLASGAASADDGVQELLVGTKDLKEGAHTAADGAGKLSDGSSELANGLKDAVDGSGELASGLADGVGKLRVSDTTAKAEVMSSPVQLTDEYYTTVKNYGTGFAPYFIALGLWVGALMGSFVFKPLDRRLVLSGGNPAMVAFANYMPLALLSIVQVLLLLLVLQFGLHLQIDHLGAYYAFGIFVALVFAAIMQMLMAAFGFPGKFIAIILLMLQLTSAAGTFPIEQTPAFFQAVNPYLPMTYVVSGMRQIMTGSDAGIVAGSVGVLAVFGLVSLAITSFTARTKRMVSMTDLHPVLQLG